MSSTAQQYCSAVLPSITAQQYCSAVLLSSTAQQYCSAVLPSSTAQQYCPAELPSPNKETLCDLSLRREVHQTRGRLATSRFFSRGVLSPSIFFMMRSGGAEGTLCDLRSVAFSGPLEGLATSWRDLLTERTLYSPQPKCGVLVFGKHPQLTVAAFTPSAPSHSTVIT